MLTYSIGHNQDITSYITQRLNVLTVKVQVNLCTDSGEQNKDVSPLDTRIEMYFLTFKDKKLSPSVVLMQRCKENWKGY